MADATKQSTVLKQDPDNARRHSARNIEMIATSILDNGFGRPIVTANEGTIVAGNATAIAAEQSGLDSMIVVESDGSKIIVVKRTDIEPGSEKFRRLALSDNRAAELADWDPAVLTSLQEDGVDLSPFWDDEELGALLATLDDAPEPLVDPDTVPEPPKEATTKPGDVWQIGRHRLMCGDSTVVTDVERLMNGNKADLVWTDPPYGVAVGDKNKWLNSIGRSNRVVRNLENDTLDETDLLQMLRDAFSLAVTYCTAGAATYHAAPAVPLHLLFGQALNELGILRQMLIWVKQNSTFSPLGVTYHWQHEPIFYGWIPTDGHSDFTDRRQTTVWEVDRPTASPEHPTMKPVELVTRSLEHTTKQGAIVLDMFAGSGTTLVACEQLNRDARLMELDPIYCDVIIARAAQTFGLTAELVS